jgi:D-glycero-D-manno-heptose 1,7-bisphosphate phosphatase
MLLAAARKWDLHLESGVLIGDRWSDIVAAHAAGCSGVLIETSFSHPERCNPDYLAADITSAVDWILANAVSMSAPRAAA